MAASRSRTRTTSPTSSTSARATASSGSPTSAGSWGPMLITARCCSAPPPCSSRARPTIRSPIGSGRSCERHRVTHLGISPTAVRALMPHGDGLVADARPARSLRIFGSTGEPWNPEPYRWLFEHRRRRARADHQLHRRHRDLGRHPRLLPHRADQALLLRGARSPAWPPRCSATTAGPCAGRWASWSSRGPWPGMTKGFWQDPARYEETYWSRWPDVWVHGDWAYVDDGRLLVHPRPLGRHAEDRGQARGPRRGGVGAGRPSGGERRRPPSACRTRSRARRSSASRCCARATRPPSRCAPS